MMKLQELIEKQHPAYQRECEAWVDVCGIYLPLHGISETHSELKIGGSETRVHLTCYDTTNLIKFLQATGSTERAIQYLERFLPRK
jgi:hypothetical protein